MEMIRAISKLSEKYGLIWKFSAISIMLIGSKIYRNVIGLELILGSITLFHRSSSIMCELSKRKGSYSVERFILVGWLIGEKNGNQKQSKRMKLNTGF